MQPIVRAGGELVLDLASPAELFEGPSPGSLRTAPSGGTEWDAIGATLGEPGVRRLLRLLHRQPHATSMLLRLGTQGDEPSRAPDPIDARLQRWCRARLAANAESIRVSRHFGVRALVACTALLGALLLLSWGLQQDLPFGPPGPLRTLAAEALVIAGWVLMWRPLEMLFFDPMQPAFENRLLRRALALPIRVEVLIAPTPTGAVRHGGSAS